MNKEKLQNKNIFSPKLSASIKLWQRVATESDIPIFIKGGALRDSLINLIHGTNLKVKDLDLIVPYGFFRVVKFAKDQGMEIIERGKRKKIPRYSLKTINSEFISDISTLQIKAISYDMPKTTNDILLENAKASNFDINTLVFSLNDEIFYDPLDSIKSIQNKTINLVSEKSLYLDPATIFDGIKIMFKTKFQFSSKTREIIKRDSILVRKIQGWFLEQKIRDVLEYVNPNRLNEELDDLGILDSRPEIREIIHKIK